MNEDTVNWCIESESNKFCVFNIATQKNWTIYTWIVIVLFEIIESLDQQYSILLKQSSKKNCFFQKFSSVFIHHWSNLFIIFLKFNSRYPIFCRLHRTNRLIENTNLFFSWCGNWIVFQIHCETLDVTLHTTYSH